MCAALVPPPDVAGCQGPFEAIHVGAAADELHQELLARLKPGGRMIIPVGPRYASQVSRAEQLMSRAEQLASRNEQG
jgi:protein-L-isoaspartate O-methyltransferase